MKFKDLHNKHSDSTFYHPVTMMCYRKNTDSLEFEFFKEWRLFVGGIWQKSGMKTGFKLI